MCPCWMLGSRMKGSSKLPSTRASVAKFWSGSNSLSYSTKGELSLIEIDRINTAGGQLQIAISREELSIVNAASNEVCNGIEVFEFDARIGADRERVAALLKEVGHLLDKMDASDK